ncbi:MAG TPA: aminomethyl-transferring glycine dehydrogenase subunit GcvPB [Chloroflexota bacterium]|nr:aminomethyl-transferring glycine dehydrogenase subunit GcvPB [Chloroflexota bacterium]
MLEPLIFDYSSPGRTAASLPESDVPIEPIESMLPPSLIRADLPLPEVGELDVVRHFTRLSQKNVCIDTTFYPLGSCTMKYNPRVNEDAARLTGLAQIHPYQDESTVQGALNLMYDLQRYLAEISGMDAISLQPAAGAHGELTGMLVVRAYHEARGDRDRKRVLIPDSAHGTNPATAKMVGYQVQSIPSDDRGNLDLGALRAALGPDVAALMITIPSTFGLFDEHLAEITAAIHDVGGLVYGDGANMNAMLGQARFGDLGVDVMHFNLHKTFSTPHGGGGPPAGPVAVKAALAPFLPVPLAARRERADGSSEYYLDFARPHSIGKVKAFYGNFGMMVRAYTYIRSLGREGIGTVGETAVLNANYLMERLRGAYDLYSDRRCKHEFVLSARRQRRANGVRALDIAKRLIDYGFHPPTIYFPIVVDEAMMIEPTETESVQTLDAFADAMLAIAREAEEDPELVKHAPHTTEIRRLDEVAAVRRPNLCWRPA